jgi:SHS2 domain-containing protein
MTEAGFEEVPHTADWSLRVWAGDLPTLFLTAAKGMNSLAGMSLSGEGQVRRSFEAEAPDAESLLVAFLSELVYYAEHEHLGFDEFEIDLETDTAPNYRLRAAFVGSRIAALNKAIKAVTFHNLKIAKTTRGWETELVFDV